MIDITSNAASLAVQFEQATKVTAETIGKSLTRIGAALVGYVVREKLSGDPLKVRTGNLRRAVFQRVDVEGHDAVLVLGADIAKAPQARVQEYGGTITPKSAQFLTIPVGEALTASGVARASASAFIADPSVLGFERAFVNQAKTAIMGAIQGHAEPVFALKTSVTLPERSYLRSTIAERKDWILAQLGADTGEAIRSALRGGA